LKSGLNSADSGLQLDLEIALNSVSAKIQPSGFFSPAEDKLKHQMTKSKALLPDCDNLASIIFRADHKSSGVRADVCKLHAMEPTTGFEPGEPIAFFSSPSG
jgi:hypothetical protein